MRTINLAIALILVGAASATLVPPASAHPVQFDCGAPLGYTAIGPTIGDINSIWIATVGTGGACIDYVFVCFYDPYVDEDCSDGRHIGIALCYKACFCCADVTTVEGRDLLP